MPITIKHFEDGFAIKDHPAWYPCAEGTRDRVSYVLGLSKPNFPVPATREVSDTAINWSCITRCQCPCCLDHYMDGLELDFPKAFT